MATLTGNVALITGATGGIGHATALALARLGCDLALHYHAASAAAQSLAQQCRALGVRAETLQADLADPAAPHALHAAARARVGPVTILFANAGTTLNLSRVADIGAVSAAAFEQTWRVNTLAPFLLAQACVPDMLAAGRGRLVFCSSVAGFTGGVVGPHYASSKAALHGLVHWLSLTYCARGITANGVAPALIGGTGMLPGDEGELAKRIPVGRLGTPDEIADTVVWMVRNGYVTNKVIGVDGGLFVQ